ncbi:MAG TPA: hypothetical protein DCQ43_07540 [Treponema sp.]|nr:hypothetical protein [Treponema sp.]
MIASLFILFIISTTIMLFEGKLIRVEEENKKLESTVKERTKELEAEKMIRFAQGLLEDVRTFNESSPVKLQIRLGINSGALVAGVIGKTKFIYDIWGDTVNVASRMESTGLPMKIHVTETTKALTSNLFTYNENSEIDVKGKGLMKTYFL